jgi:hypothetical protein
MLMHGRPPELQLHFEYKRKIKIDFVLFASNKLLCTTNTIDVFVVDTVAYN